jgi:predicted alpha/beta hydrolase family esterase
MRQILFVQGGGEGAHDEWDNKLVDSLKRAVGPGYEIRYPRMPNEADPSYARWKPALAKELAALDEGAILVGHSVGGTILISTLAGEPLERKLAGVFLIAAPFVGAGGWSSEDFKTQTDLGARLPPQLPIFLYHGSRDDVVPILHVDLYEEAIRGATVRRLQGRDHQLDNDLADVAEDIRALA